MDDSSVIVSSGSSLIRHLSTLEFSGEIAKSELEAKWFCLNASFPVPIGKIEKENEIHVCSAFKNVCCVL